MNKKRLFFSLKGVNINDDDALAAFTQHVWERTTAAFTGEQDCDQFVQLDCCSPPPVSPPHDTMEPSRVES